MSKNLQVSTTYVLSHLGLIFFVYPIDVIEITSQAHWLPVLFGFAFHLLVVTIYLKGLRYFKGQNIVEILMERNKLLAWCILFPALLYMAWLAVLSVRGFAEVVSIAILSDTPLWVLILLLLVIPGFITSQGMIGGILRLSVLLGVLFVVPVVFVIATSFQNADWHYLFPLWPDSGAMTFLLKPHFNMSLFAYSGAFLMFGFLPSFAKFKPKAIYWGSLVLLPAYLISVYVPVLTLGEQTASQLQFPYLFVVDTVEINWLMFERINVFLLLSLIAFFMFYISLLIWQILCVIQLGIKDISSNYLVPIIILPILIGCLIIPDWRTAGQLLQWSMRFQLFVVIVIPGYLLTIGWLHAKKSKVELKNL